MSCASPVHHRLRHWFIGVGLRVGLLLNHGKNESDKRQERVGLLLLLGFSDLETKNVGFSNRGNKRQERGFFRSGNKEACCPTGFFKSTTWVCACDLGSWETWVCACDLGSWERRVLREREERDGRWERKRYREEKEKKIILIIIFIFVFVFF